MIGKVYRIIGKFNPHIGMTLATSLTGGVAYGYKRNSLTEIQKWPKARQFHFLELESQKNFSHLTKMSNIKHFIIEETDIILPEYEEGSFEEFATDIKRLTTEHNMNIYFNSTWKEDKLTAALEHVGITVNEWKFEDVINKEIQPELIVDTVIDQHIVESIIESESIDNKPEAISKPIVEKTSWKSNTKSQKHKEQVPHKYVEPVKTELPDNLEFFYSQPKTKWQKLKSKIVTLIEKTINNF